MHIRLLIVFFTGISFLTTAQKFANSPFSSYGLGEYGGLDHSIFSGMGNNSIALIDSTTLNFYNPSSYASLGKGQPLFSTGISSRFSQYTSGGDATNNKYIGLDHFALAIPFGNNFGLAFGLKPFSRTGYDFYEIQTAATPPSGSAIPETMKYIYRGSGGTHDVFFGLAAKLFEVKGHRLSLGANFGYIFGTTLNERISYIDGNYTSTDVIPGGVEDRGYTVKSVHADFGMNYLWTINKNHSLMIGGVYTPSQKLTATRNDLLAYSADVNDPSSFELLDTAVNEKGHIVMPATYGIGFNYTFRPKDVENRSKIYQLSFSGEIKLMEWSSYETRFSQAGTENFSNTTRFGFGMQFVPHYNYLDRSMNIGYLSRVRYRAGFQYATLPLVVQNKQQTDIAVTAGIGLPIAIQRSSSSLNFGVVVGKRGNGSDQSVNEGYVGINFGVTISPGQNDRWFRKFKID